MTKRSITIHRLAFILLLPAVLVGCTEPLPAVTETHTTTAAPATESPATELPSASPTASPAPSMDFPMTADQFEANFNDYIMMSWKPEEVLDYLEFDLPVPGLEPSDHKLRIVAVENGRAEVNEVLWVLDGNEPNGFRVDDPSPENKTYELAEGTGIWLLTGMYGYCRVSADELDSFVQSYDCEYTLWNYTVKDDKIIVLAEQYIP